MSHVAVPRWPVAHERFHEKKTPQRVEGVGHDVGSFPTFVLFARKGVGEFQRASLYGNRNFFFVLVRKHSMYIPATKLEH